MTELLLLLAVFVLVACVAAIFHPGGFVGWCLQEWRLMRAETWAPPPNTLSDPDVASMVARQKAMGERMKRQGVSLLAGRAYRPALTKPTAPPPRAAAVVTPIRAKGGKR
jgi:hypothetical protein